MKKEDLASIRDGAIIQQLLPYLESELKSLTLAVDNKAATAFENGTMTPDMAHNLWAERIAYRKTLRRFNALIKVGQALGASNAAALDN